MKKKKILFFLWSFSLGGGAEKILSTIVNNLDREKYDIDIIEIEHFDKGYEPVNDNIKILKSWQDYRQSKIKRAILWRIRKFFPNLVRKIMVKEKYDIEISFTIINPPFEFSRDDSVKKIAWIHGSIEDFMNDSQKRNNHRKHLEVVDKIISVSEKTKESIISVYPEYEDKVLTIYNGYDFDSILEKSNEWTDINIEKNSICVIGRIENLKGSLEVYETIKKLHKNLNKKYHLYFLGAGELENHIKELVQKDNLQDYIHFLGYQKNPYNLIKKMDLMFSMSKQEGFSGAIVEGLALGIPFISTDVGGVKELSNNGKFGEIVNSTDDACECIVNYFENSMSVDKSEMKNFITQFTISEQMKNINEILE